jgi:hypothetical protein
MKEKIKNKKANKSSLRKAAEQEKDRGGGEETRKPGPGRPREGFLRLLRIPIIWQ